MKTLKQLLSGIEYKKCNVDMDICIENLTIDEQESMPNSLYFSLKGDAEKINDALNNGAVAIVCQECVIDIPYIKVTNIRKAMSHIAANFYDNAHKDLTIIGVIGTNGKTTTTHTMAAILHENRYKTAIIGTLGVDLDGELVESDLTTPDPIELHKIFAMAKAKQITHIVMEISAHAIFFEKLYNVKCDFAIFTNISQDHLDFFGDMDNYIKTKTDFFNSKNIQIAVVNADDSYGAKLIEQNKVFTLSYGLKNPSDVFAVNIDYKNARTQCVINAFDKVFELDMPILGEFNVYNVLSAITVGITMGISNEIIINALNNLPEVPGRFNILKSDITVIIDYAHTPDGLENILSAVKKLAAKGIITVFGCGGNRDKAKRPIMGEISAKYSDISIITSDNPRLENPAEIVEEIAEGHKKISNNYIKVVDRVRAINFAVRIAQKDDIILIAGKGAERYIDEKGTKRPYSDKQTVQNAIRRYRSDKVDN
ncbi:MAG: UDP-N-acetylmuramoyl-L-alanyl-D-glutamate--2,6-diaminopimelate ligase [Clostridiales bacterium]|nr:UDP-N-acetylmuramoyl-L-alanyl-D-glutamate--2,6-diaminopimelate ligase [Clostridiales bacterium]